MSSLITRKAYIKRVVVELADVVVDESDNSLQIVLDSEVEDVLEQEIMNFVDELEEIEGF